MVLCFSPVGSTLRVRARKFPAIVNCTNIDWFHEWPEEALISVSTRFLSEVELISEDVRSSISRFMAYVHSSVNEMSKVYLANERRYNYTTPKSFLELVRTCVLSPLPSVSLLSPPSLPPSLLPPSRSEQRRTPKNETKQSTPYN